MRILFATTRGAGHFGPMIPLAHACLRAGHDVVVVGPGSAAGLAARAGLPFTAVGEPPADAVAAAWAPVWSSTSAPGAAYVIQDLFIRLHAATALPGMLETLADRRPDVVVRETLELSSALAAERLDIPQVRFGIHLVTRTDADEGLVALAAAALDELRGAAGLRPDPTAERIRESPVFTLAPRSIDDPGAGPRAAVSRFRDPGAPAAPPLPRWPGGDDRPLIYVSFGSHTPASEHFPRLFRETLLALDELPVRVLMTIGDGADPAELGALPGSVRVEGWFPQAAAMPHAAAMVGHGGSGSTLAALAAGVPQALVPLFVDGPLNAGRVSDLDAGITVGPGAPDVGEAVRRLLDDPRYRRGAARVAEEIRALPPIDEAVGMLRAIAGR